MGSCEIEKPSPTGKGDRREAVVEEGRWTTELSEKHFSNYSVP